MMQSLFLTYDTCTNGYRIDVLDILSMMAIFCGILVIISKNPVVSVLFLIGLFASISCNLIMLGLSFLGLTYLMVYIGAVSILFLFILMLINVRISELQSNTTNSIALAIALGIALNHPIFQVLPYNIAIFKNYYNLNYILSNISRNPEGWHSSNEDPERSNQVGGSNENQSKVVTSGASEGTFSTYSDDKSIYFVTSKT